MLVTLSSQQSQNVNLPLELVATSPRKGQRWQNDGHIQKTWVHSSADPQKYLQAEDATPGMWQQKWFYHAKSQHSLAQNRWLNCFHQIQTYAFNESSIHRLPFLQASHCWTTHIQHVYIYILHIPSQGHTKIVNEQASNRMVSFISQ